METLLASSFVLLIFVSGVFVGFQLRRQRVVMDGEYYSDEDIPPTMEG